MDIIADLVSGDQEIRLRVNLQIPDPTLSQSVEGEQRRSLDEMVSPLILT